MKLGQSALLGTTLLCSSFANAQDNVPLNASKKSEHFTAVSSQLEVGGIRFNYADSAPTTGMINTCVDIVMQAYGDTLLDGVNRKKLENIFKLGAVKASGSSITDQGDFYHYRTYNYMPGEKSSFTIAYGDTAPSVALQYAPAGADFVAEVHFDGKSSTTVQELIDALGPNLGGMYKQLAEEQKSQNPFMETYQELYPKLDSRICFIADLEPEGYEKIPGLPVSGQALFTITNAKELWAAATPHLEGLQKNDAGEYIEFPQEAAPGIKPLLQYDTKSETIFVSTSRKYLDQCLAVKGNGLSKDPDFTKLSYGLPESFANMVYVSPAVAKLVIAQADFYLTMQEEQIPAEAMPAIQTVMSALKNSPIRKTGTLYVVHYGNKGTLHVANSPLFMPEQNVAVTASVGLLTTSTLFIGAEYYKKGADQASCKVNINAIQKATRSYQNIYNQQEGDKLTWDMLVGSGKIFENKPMCPAGGTYTLSPTFPKEGEPACRCSHPEHNFSKEETRTW